MKRLCHGAPVCVHPSFLGAALHGTSETKHECVSGVGSAVVASKLAGNVFVGYLVCYALVYVSFGVLVQSRLCILLPHVVPGMGVLTGILGEVGSPCLVMGSHSERFYLRHNIGSQSILSLVPSLV